MKPYLIILVLNETTTVYIDYEGSHYKISVGSIFYGVYGDDLSFNMEVIGFNHDVLSNANAYGKVTKTGMAGITFQTQQIGYDFGMNNSDTNVGGWKESNIRSSSLSELKKRWFHQLFVMMLHLPLSRLTNFPDSVAAPQAV